MSKQIFHNDFNYMESINVREQLQINKIKKKVSTLAWIMLSAFGLISIFLLFGFEKIKLYTFMLLFFLNIIVLTINIKYLFFDTKIIGLAYGNVKYKEEKKKIMTGHDDRKICPWYEENDYKNYQKPLISSIKSFYYIDVVFSNIEGEMKHISMYKNDFENIEEGDEVIVIRFKNNNVIAISAKKTVHNCESP